MEHLFRPWRLRYVTAPDEDDGCFLCRGAQTDDPAASWVLCRRSRTFAILNAFPYNTGHVMVAPLRHVGDLEALDTEEQAEVMGLVIECLRALRAEYAPHGFNLGVNLGQVAGAGVPGHLHVHLVPRWGGDTNFMPVVGQAKVLPEDLAGTYGRLAPRLQ
ncbi:MAG: HIT family protein [Actinomycetota bacterium]